MARVPAWLPASFLEVRCLVSAKSPNLTIQLIWIYTSAWLSSNCRPHWMCLTSPYIPNPLR